MAVPASAEARVFYRSALRHRADAATLLEAGRTTGAVYLAGYGIECILKALILANLAPTARAATLDSFRGAKAHDYRWLRSRYLRDGGAGFPLEITKSFTLVDEWSTEMRYLPRMLRSDESMEFLAAADAVIDWADGRIL